jgi:hypothetical protein
LTCYTRFSLRAPQKSHRKSRPLSGGLLNLLDAWTADIFVRILVKRS